jgi:glyoxylase-like metal-dependent hydrolase (beta-lactamase superfamily II)
MLFRQIFDSGPATFPYLLAARRGAEALIIDPGLKKVDQYLRLMDELDLRLVKAIDTHMHADHLSGLGALRDATRCPPTGAMGLSQEKGVKEGWGLTAGHAIAEAGREGGMLVDLREGNEHLHDANIPGSVHAPCAALDQYSCSGGLRQFEATTEGKRPIFFAFLG